MVKFLGYCFGLKLMDLFGYDTLVYIYIFEMLFNILCLVLFVPILLLVLVFVLNFKLYQMDVKSAFLNGML